MRGSGEAGWRALQLTYVWFQHLQAHLDGQSNSLRHLHGLQLLTPSVQVLH